MCLPVERHDRHHHARQSAEHEHEEEAEQEPRGRGHRELAARQVASHEKIWMPVGIATAMLAAETKADALCGIPVANM